MSKRSMELVDIPAYFKKLGSYIAVGPKGLVPLNYVVEIDLVRDKAIVDKMKNDPQFAERFSVSALTPMKINELDKIKTGKIAVSIKG